MTDKNVINASDSRGPLGKLLVILVPLLIIGAAYIASQALVKSREKPQERVRKFRPLSVAAEYAKRGDVQLTVDTQGEVRPQIEINLVPQVSGKITYVSPNFIEGGLFKKGETLVRLEATDYEIAVYQAEADIASAEQALIREIAEGDIARRDYAELGRGTPSPLALREPQRAQSEAMVKAAKGRLQTAQLQLERTRVRAPFSGRVRSKVSDLGQFVNPGAPLGQIFSSDVLEVRIPLTDADLGAINLPLAFVAKDRASAPEVNISTVLAGKRRYWSGRLMRTDSVVNTQTRALSAIVEIVDPYGKGRSQDGYPLAPGLFVDAQLKGQLYEDAITIPRDGLRPGNKVYIVDKKGKAEIREVEIIDTNVDRAVIASGISEGELVVTSPMEPSRTELTLKVFSASDPSLVLVDPPKPKGFGKEDKSAASGGNQSGGNGAGGNGAGR